MSKVASYKDVQAEIDRINGQLSDFVQTVRRELVFTFRDSTYEASWGMTWDYDGTLEPFFALKWNGFDARYLPGHAPNKEEAALLAKICNDRVMQWVHGKAEFPETLQDLVGDAKIEVPRKVEVRCIDELVEIKS